MLAQDVNVTTLSADFDSSKAAQLRKAFKKLVDGGRIFHIVDLDAVEVLDSAALGALITALRLVREVGGAVHLVAKREPVKRILSITALDRIFGVHATLDEAMAAFGNVPEASGPKSKRKSAATTVARNVAAAAAGLALVFGFRPVAAQAPVEPQAVIGHVIEQNPSLRTYQAHVDVAIRMTSFPYLSPRLTGETYFKRPNNYEVVFAHVPSYAKGFDRLYSDIGDPSAWERRFVITTEGEKMVDGHRDIVLKLVQRVRGMIDHQTVYVDDTTWHIDAMEWHYYTGGVITMKQKYKNEGEYAVISSQEAQIAIPRVHAVASAVYTNYRANVAIDDSVFTKAGQ